MLRERLQQLPKGTELIITRAGAGRALKITNCDGFVVIPIYNNTSYGILDRRNLYRLDLIGCKITVISADKYIFSIKSDRNLNDTAFDINGVVNELKKIHIKPTYRCRLKRFLGL